MNPFLSGLARAVSQSFDLPGPIYEVGAYQVQGQAEIADLRGLFPGKKYVGVDMRAGPGVDLVADVQNLNLPAQSVGTLIAMSLFEHVPCFWKGIEEANRVLRPDGVLLITCPFFFYIHNYPGDYWRFTPQALEVLLGGYERKIIGCHGPKKRPRDVWAVAFGKDYPAISPTQIATYRRLLDDAARQIPLAPWRVLRYRLARLLCGGGPFAPYLEQNRWESDYLDASAGAVQVS